MKKIAHTERPQGQFPRFNKVCEETSNWELRLLFLIRKACKVCKLFIVDTVYNVLSIFS